MINVIGIGQNRDNMTLGAIKAIEESDVIIGYKKYVDQIEDLIEGKEIVKKGMGDEIARAEFAIKKSQEGQTVSLISSGDPGVFGMANVLYQIVSKYENVEIKNKLTNFKTREQILQWFEMLGIADKKDSLVRRLSFGQQQRVAVMRALVQPFDFFLADEPISHLDDRNSEVMAELIQTEACSQGASIISTSIGKRLPLIYDFTLKL